jgi:hypothetical protein
MREVARSQGGTLKGLDFRLKGTSSMSRKIVSDADAKGITYADSASQIADALRYTIQLDPANYSEGLSAARTNLEARGFKFIEGKDKNYWSGNIYKGFNARVQTPGGYNFELQFHTPESLAAKDPGHLLYERYRVLDPESESAKALWAQMEALWARVEPPPGVNETWNAAVARASARASSPEGVPAPWRSARGSQSRDR